MSDAHILGRRTPALHPDDLAAFLAVAEAGSVTLAADRLGLTQSGVSRKLGGLEATLGFRLFDRTAGRVHLNRQGRAFAPHARRAIETMTNLPRLARSIREGAYDRVRVVATSSIMHGLMPVTMAGYLAERPDLAPMATMRSLAEILLVDAGDAFDLALAPLPAQPFACNLVFKAEFGLALAAPRALLPEGVSPREGVWPDLAAFQGLPFISLDPFAAYQERVEQALAGLGISLNYVAETTSVVTAAMLARAGVGCAFIDPFIVDALASPDLVIARTHPEIRLGYGVHAPNGSDISAEAMRFLRIMEGVVARGAADD